MNTAEAVEKRMHTCYVCGKIDEWSESWSWYGSYDDIDNGKSVVKVCSAKCKGNAGENCENVKTKKVFFTTKIIGQIGVEK